MSLSFIVIQAIGFIPSVIAFTSLQSPNRKKILVLQFICCFMWLAHYSLLGAYTVAMTNIVGILRAILCYYNDRPWAKSNWIPVGLIALYIIGTVATWQGMVSLLPSIAMILTTIALWSHNMKLTRLLFFLNSPFMLASNILTGSYSTAVIECAALISFAIAIYRFDIKPERSGNNAKLERVDAERRA